MPRPLFEDALIAIAALMVDASVPPKVTALELRMLQDYCKHAREAVLAASAMQGNKRLNPLIEEAGEE